MSPGGLLAGSARYQPASYDFSSSSGSLTATAAARGISAGDPTTQMVFSIWSKGAPSEFLHYTFGGSIQEYVVLQVYNDGYIDWLGNDTPSSTLEWGRACASGSALSDGNWHHYFFRYDSTEGTAADRIQVYRDGSLLSDFDAGYAGDGLPGSSEDCYAFHENANLQISYENYDAKLAFIQIIQDAAPAVTDVAFDDGGTWTHKTYAGSRGTYGIFLDGTNGFIDVENDVDFSSYNGATGVELDFADLPPYSV